MRKQVIELKRRNESDRQPALGLLGGKSIGRRVGQAAPTGVRSRKALEQPLELLDAMPSQSDLASFGRSADLSFGSERLPKLTGQGLDVSINSCSRPGDPAKERLDWPAAGEHLPAKGLPLIARGPGKGLEMAQLEFPARGVSKFEKVRVITKNGNDPTQIRDVPSATHRCLDLAEGHSAFMQGADPRAKCGHGRPAVQLTDLLAKVIVLGRNAICSDGPIWDEAQMALKPGPANQEL